MTLVGIEGRADQAMVMVVRADAVCRDAKFLQMDAGLPVQGLRVAVREILSVFSRVCGNLLPEREADGLAAAEEAMNSFKNVPMQLVC